MGDENQPTKKRAAGRELSRDNPGLDEDEDAPQLEVGTFQRASDEVLSTRKIVKPRRRQPSSELAASSNPFAGIRLVPPTAPPPATATATAAATAAATATAMTETQPTEGKETGDAVQIEGAESESEVESQVSVEKPTNEKHAEGDEALKEGKNDDEKQDEADEGLKDEKKDDEKQAEAVKDDKKDDENPNADGGDAPLSSFQQLSSSQNAFTGLSGTGFSTLSFSFGAIPKDGSVSQSSSLPSFSFGASNNGTTPLFGTPGTSEKTEGAVFPSMQEVLRETGEENEDTVFNADSALFEFLDGGWKERGKGDVKVNVVKDETRKARLVMRTKGNLRLILNASLYPDMKLTKMDKKGVTFACVNIATEGKDGLTTFALKFRDVSVVEEFTSVVSVHKGKPASTTLKTPEYLPKTLDE